MGKWDHGDHPQGMQTNTLPFMLCLTSALVQEQIQEMLSRNETNYVYVLSLYILFYPKESKSVWICCTRGIMAYNGTKSPD